MIVKPLKKKQNYVPDSAFGVIYLTFDFADTFSLTK